LIDEQEESVPRSEKEMLAVVYERSKQIRTRRYALRLAAGSLVLALGAGVPLVVRSTGDTIAPRHLAAPSLKAEGPSRPAGSAVPTACACTLASELQEHTPTSGRTSPSAPSRRVAATTAFAFASDRSSNYEIYSMRADGSHLRRLTHDPAPDRDPAWSPDGKRMAFVRLKKLSDVMGDIYVMHTDGSNARFLTKGAGPAWSPDGRRIVFYDYASGFGGGAVGARTWVMGTDGKNKSLVAENAADPAWTPDSAHVVFGFLQGDASTNVNIAAVDGSGQKQLTRDPVFACQPAVSPDGRYIGYVAAEGETFHLKVMDLDGAHQRRLTHNAQFEVGPTWSADASVIAVERGAEYDMHAGPPGIVISGAGRSKIFFVNTDGSGEVMLPSGDYSDADPAFSPRAP
jgi:TolB protein